MNVEIALKTFFFVGGVKEKRSCTSSKTDHKLWDVTLMTEKGASCKNWYVV